MVLTIIHQHITANDFLIAFSRRAHVSPPFCFHVGSNFNTTTPSKVNAHSRVGLERNGRLGLYKDCFTEHTSNVWGLSFSCDGSLLASCSSDKQVIVYSIEDLLVLKILSLHNNTVWSCKFLYQENNILASVSEDCTVKMPSITAGNVCDTFNFDFPLESLDVNNESQLMCVSACIGMVKFG